MALPDPSASPRNPQWGQTSLWHRRHLAGPRHCERKIDNRGSHFYPALYWAQALASQDDNAALKEAWYSQPNFWDADKTAELAQALDLDRTKVYKWNYDQRKKAGQSTKALDKL